MQKSLYELTQLSREVSDKYPGPDLPIRGGWGYKEDACIIDKNDPIIDPTVRFHFTELGMKNLCGKKNLLELITYVKMKDFRHRMEDGEQSLVITKDCRMVISFMRSLDLRMVIGIHSKKNGKDRMVSLTRPSIRKST